MSVIKKPETAAANPAPLGLLAFGLTTVLLNFHNAGFIALSSMILAMGLFYGGLAQIIAGILEWKKNNTFGMTAFISYGFFWLALVALLVMPRLGWAEAADNMAMGAFLMMWGLFTAIMFIASLKHGRALPVVFGTLIILFALLSLGDFTVNAALIRLAGLEGIICGLSAIYLAAAQILNEAYKRIILPV